MNGAEAGIKSTLDAAAETKQAGQKDEVSGKAKATRGKVLKRKQRIRRERGKERAEVVGDKEVRRRDEGGGGREGRGADWDELNKRIRAEKGKSLTGKSKGKEKGKATKGKREMGDWVDDDEDEDGNMDMDVDDNVNGGGYSVLAEEKGEPGNDEEATKSATDAWKAVDEDEEIL